MGDETSQPAVRTAPEGIADPISAMTPRFNWPFRWFAKRFFSHLQLDDETVERLRELESKGSVVYVMRYASRLDYFLFNTLFARRGVRLSAFANGIRFWYYRPLGAALRALLTRHRQRSERAKTRADAVAPALSEARHHVHAVVGAGESMFLFLHTARFRAWLRGRRAALEQSRRQRDLLSETVRVVWKDDRPVYLVPVALFWRKGPRSARGFLNLTYGAPTRPSDIAKVFSFLLTYRSLAVKMGEPIDLQGFVRERRSEGRRSVVRKVRRSILMFLYREERAVEGPTLWPRHRVQEEVLAHPAVRRAIAERGQRKRGSPEAARAEAEKIFREIAANMNSTLLALLYTVAGWVFRRMFGSIEATGLSKIAEYAKTHPVVLVPSHRSYFDFLILSWLFYGNYLVPPHIAARDNMKFGPFGFIFRRAGAFFLRKSFDDPLYKEVFRRYVGYLVKEGFTQEFFIEGGRSRTGKTLQPRLGMLSWNIEAFVASNRRDLFFVPIGITYERLVEEGAMIEELEGGEKQAESMLGLVRARKFLKSRFGSVYVNFGEPVSLASSLAGRKELFFDTEDESAADQRRAFTEGLGNELVERINWAMTANATSVAACALLGQARTGMFRAELTQRMAEIVELLRLQDVRLTPALEADEPEFEVAIAFLVSANLIKTTEDPRGDVLYYEESRRRALDVYRNVLFHFLVAPSLLARRLLQGCETAALRDDLAFWLDLLYTEFFAPHATILRLQFDAFLDYFERLGLVERNEERLDATEKGRGYFLFLSEQTQSIFEAYYTAFGAVLATDGELGAKQLEKLAKEHFERAELLGEVTRREAWNPVTFRNAVELLTRRGVLATVPDRKERTYTRGPAFEDLTPLLARLAGALSPG